MRAPPPHRDPASHSPVVRPRPRLWGLLDACFDLARLSPPRPPQSRLGLEPLEARDQPSGSDVIDVSALLANGLAGWQTLEGGGTPGDRGTAATDAGDLLSDRGQLVPRRRPADDHPRAWTPASSGSPTSGVPSTRSPAASIARRLRVSLINAAGTPVVPPSIRPPTRTSTSPRDRRQPGHRP